MRSAASLIHYADWYLLYCDSTPRKGGSPPHSLPLPQLSLSLSLSLILIASATHSRKRCLITAADKWPPPYSPKPIFVFYFISHRWFDWGFRSSQLFPSSALIHLSISFYVSLSMFLSLSVSYSFYTAVLLPQQGKRILPPKNNNNYGFLQTTLNSLCKKQKTTATTITHTSP